MRMTTLNLLILRLFNCTLGRSDRLAGKFKAALIKRMIQRPKQSYVATSRWFDPKDLDD
jgi:hypothetical protein